MSSQVFIMTQEEVDRFNKGSKDAALAQAKLNPMKLRPRPSATVRAELDRTKLSLNSVGAMLQKSEETLAKATAALAEAFDQLAELRKAGFRENSMPVQKLLGSSFRSKFTDLQVHQDGVIDRLNRAIAEHTPRIKVLEASHRREADRIAPIVRKLEAELEEALRLERLMGGR
jgi:septal ring factor EnvC (AmiA/AmiB activator)